MLVTEFVETATLIAEDLDTLYIMGCFGAPMNEKNKARYKKNHDYNKKPERSNMIQCASDSTFGFDCCGLVKSILWGFSADRKKTYGGAKYKANNVPDTNSEGLIQKCKDVSTNMKNITAGELVWMKGHCGIYIGNGRVVEATPKWENRVQITGVEGMCHTCEHERNWTKHGRLPWVTYEVVTPKVTVDNQLIWDMLIADIGNPYGVAAIMGNYEAESAMSSINLQNTANSKYNITDLEYTMEVDAGERDFIDGKGYGLAQWTGSGRKGRLYNFAKEKGVSIGELSMQVEFTLKELKESYKSVYKILKESKDLRECSNAVLIKYEAPASKNKQSTQDARYEKSLKWYNTFVEKYICPTCGQEVVKW